MTFAVRALGKMFREESRELEPGPSMRWLADESHGISRRISSHLIYSQTAPEYTVLYISSRHDRRRMGVMISRIRNTLNSLGPGSGFPESGDFTSVNMVNQRFHGIPSGNASIFPSFRGPSIAGFSMAVKGYRCNVPR